MPRSMHLHTEIYPNLKSISELFKMYMKSLDSFILASRDNWVSCNQTLGCLRFTEIVEFLERSLASMLMRYCCSMIGCYFFSRHNRFAETHSHLQLSYHITDRLLAAGNKHSYTLILAKHFFVDNFFIFRYAWCKLNCNGFNVSLRPWRKI